MFASCAFTGLGLVSLHLRCEDMTRDRDFKTLVRSRMATTGEPYTQAREALLRESARSHEPAEPKQEPATRPLSLAETFPQHARALRSFVDGDTIRTVPAKRTTRMVLALDLTRHFAPGWNYAEREVTAILRRAHEDHAFLRREMVNAGYLERVDGVYSLTQQVPERDERWAHEYPAWERAWFAHLTRASV